MTKENFTHEELTYKEWVDLNRYILDEGIECTIKDKVEAGPEQLKLKRLMDAIIIAIDEFEEFIKTDEFDEDEHEGEY